MKCCYLCTAPPSQEVRVKVIVKVECCYLCTAPPSQGGSHYGDRGATDSPVSLDAVAVEA